jgi:hypothetical protein
VVSAEVPGSATPAEPVAAPSAGAPAEPAAPAQQAASAQPAAASAQQAAASAQPAADSGSVQVSVVPGITRYHRSDCLLIRFLTPDDLQVMTRQAATDGGCVPCKACKPDQEPVGSPTT